MSTTVEPGPPALAKPLNETPLSSTRPNRAGSGASQSSREDTLADGNNQQALDREEKGQEQEEKPEIPAQEKKKEEKDPFLVTLEGREHLNPHTWPVWYRWWLTGFGGLLVLNASECETDPLEKLRWSLLRS